MAYTLDTVIDLGPSASGLTDLRAQLVNTTGGAVGSAVSTGFVELASSSGVYLWHYAAFPDGHRGAAKFYSNADSATLLAACAINPEEGENLDAKVTSRSSHAAADVWAVGTRTLSSFGTLVADAAAAVWAAVSRTLSDKTGFSLTSGEHTAIKADVWDEARSSHAIPGTFGQGVASVQGNVAGSVGSVTGAVGSVTGSVASVTGSVGSVTAGVTVTTNSDKTGFALTSGEHTAIATDTRTGMTAQGYTTGRAPLLDHLDADLSSRSALVASDIHTQIVNALSVDTIAELAQGVPPATPTVYQVLELLYMLVRNGVTEDGTYRKVYNNAGVCITKWTTSDSGGQFTVQKATSGP